MNAVIAVCPVHGSFPSVYGRFNNVEGLHLRNNKEQCPECGRAAQTMEGSFNVRDGIVEILSAPHWTRQALREVAVAAETARAALEQTENSAAIRNVLADLQKEFQALNPELGKRFAEQNSVILAAAKSKRWTQAFSLVSVILSVALWAYSPDDVSDFIGSTFGTHGDQEIQHQEHQPDSAEDHEKPAVIEVPTDPERKQQSPNEATDK